MYQKDFILRMIEMLAELIAGILGLIKKGEFGKASQVLENSYFELLREDAAYFRKIPIEELTSNFLEEHNYTYQHLEILAGLFSAEAELSLAQGKNDESLTYFEKSLLLYEFVIKESKTFSMEKEDKLVYLKDQIGKLRN